MKKYLLPGLLAFLFLFPAEGAAQTFRGGVIGGFNLSQIDGDRLGGFNQPGLNLGARVYTVFSDRWELSLEMLFSQQGSSRVRTDDPASIYDRIRLNIVDVPVMMTFRDWKLQVGAGASYGRLMSYRAVDYLGEDITESENYNPDLFFLVLGVTFYSTEQLGFDFRWSRSLNDMRADEGASSLIGRTISVRAMYLFN